MSLLADKQRKARISLELELELTQTRTPHDRKAPLEWVFEVGVRSGMRTTTVLTKLDHEATSATAVACFRI